MSNRVPYGIVITDMTKANNRILTIDTSENKVYEFTHTFPGGEFKWYDDFGDRRSFEMSEAAGDSGIVVLYKDDPKPQFDPSLLEFRAHPNSVSVKYAGEAVGYFDANGFTRLLRSDVSFAPESMMVVGSSGQGFMRSGIKTR